MSDFSFSISVPNWLIVIMVVLFFVSSALSLTTAILEYKIEKLKQAIELYPGLALVPQPTVEGGRNVGD